MRKGGYRDNPYKILLLAIPFLVGGIILLLQTKPGWVVAYPAHSRDMVAESFDVVSTSVTMAHVGGVVGIVIAGIIVGTYFKIRKR